MKNPFWDYSLAHYTRPEVAQCCLTYQNQYGANVNLMLFCCWLGSSRVRLERQELAEVQVLIKPWDSQAIQPLRMVRRFMSSSPLSSDVMMSQLQQVELMAEQVIQDDLFDWVLRKGITINNDMGSGFWDTGCQIKNLNVYFSSLDCGLVPENSPLLWSINGIHNEVFNGSQEAD
ncbi:MAG: TIGR02444 family protein, partial [Porticoccus sp.]|nr:TIGR02444 family protein [Porticoccus sp.]